MCSCVMLLFPKNIYTNIKCVDILPNGLILKRFSTIYNADQSMQILYFEMKEIIHYFGNKYKQETTS